MKTILTLTMNPALDLFLSVPQLVPDRKLRCRKPADGAGGGGINVSRAIRSLGGTSTALFPAGGATGQRLVQLLQRQSIATNCIRIADATRQDVNIFDDATMKEFRLIVPGPDVGIEEWQHCLRALQSISPRPDYVVASGSLPPGVPVDFYSRLAAMASDLGFRLIVDTSGEPLRYASKGTFLLKPNLSELAVASGVAITETAIEGAARAIVTSGRSEIVVVSMGAAGAMLVDARGARRIAAPVVTLASKVGAGDSMVAGMVLALARGMDIDDAVAFGVAAGSAAVMRPGHHLCKREDAESLYQQIQPSMAAPVAV
jgi:6-phosphofructokinase 2